MKAIFKYITMLVMPLLFWSCKEEPTTQPAEYYVKYEATVQSVYTSENINYTVSTEKGLKTFIGNNSKSFSETFGPFKKGVTVNFSVNTNGNASCTAYIYVCRGSEPFSLKATESGSRFVSTWYKIDF